MPAAVDPKVRAPGEFAVHLMAQLVGIGGSARARWSLRPEEAPGTCHAFALHR